MKTNRLYMKERLSNMLKSMSKVCLPIWVGLVFLNIVFGNEADLTVVITISFIVSFIFYIISALIFKLIEIDLDKEDKNENTRM